MFPVHIVHWLSHTQHFLVYLHKEGHVHSHIVTGWVIPIIVWCTYTRRDMFAVTVFIGWVIPIIVWCACCQEGTCFQSQCSVVESYPSLSGVLRQGGTCSQSHCSLVESYPSLSAVLVAKKGHVPSHTVQWLSLTQHCLGYLHKKGHVPCHTVHWLSHTQYCLEYLLSRRDMSYCCTCCQQEWRCFQSQSVVESYPALSGILTLQENLFQPHGSLLVALYPAS